MRSTPPRKAQTIQARVAPAWDWRPAKRSSIRIEAGFVWKAPWVEGLPSSFAFPPPATPKRPPNGSRLGGLPAPLVTGVTIRREVLKLCFWLPHEDFHNPTRQRVDVNIDVSSLTRRVMKKAQLQRSEVGLLLPPGSVSRFPILSWLGDAVPLQVSSLRHRGSG